MHVEVGETGKGSEIVFILVFLWKTCAKKSIHANTGNGKSNLVNCQAHEMVYIVLCLRDCYRQTCWEFCFFLYIWGYNSVGVAGKDFMYGVK